VTGSKHIYCSQTTGGLLLQETIEKSVVTNGTVKHVQIIWT